MHKSAFTLLTCISFFFDAPLNTLFYNSTQLYIGIELLPAHGLCCNLLTLLFSSHGLSLVIVFMKFYSFHFFPSWMFLSSLSRPCPPRSFTVLARTPNTMLGKNNKSKYLCSGKHSAPPCCRMMVVVNFSQCSVSGLGRSFYSSIPENFFPGRRG